MEEEFLRIMIIRLILKRNRVSLQIECVSTTNLLYFVFFFFS
ncbi:hypothetical protein LINPERHAP1_LOCUS8513 [Linum perenne]